MYNPYMYMQCTNAHSDMRKAGFSNTSVGNKFVLPTFRPGTLAFFNQVWGRLSGWLGQDQQGAASEGGHLHPTESPIPQQGWRLELPRCWMAAFKNTRSRTDQRPVAPTDSSSDSTWWDARLYSDKCLHQFHLLPWRKPEYLAETLARQTCSLYWY